MSTIAFDTLRYVRQLEASGIAPQQAEAFVNAQREILAAALDACQVPPVYKHAQQFGHAGLRDAHGR